MNVEQVQIAERQLDRVLQFASRVENKVSVLLATNLGVLAIALMNLDYSDISTWYVAAPLFLALFFISSSLFHLYYATYPNLSGGSSSLIYFSEIAKRKVLEKGAKFDGETNIWTERTFAFAGANETVYSTNYTLIP